MKYSYLSLNENSHIPAPQRGNLQARYASLPTGDPTKLTLFRTLLTDAQNTFRALPPVVMLQPIVQPRVGFGYLQPPEQLIQSYFTHHGLFGEGKAIVNLKSFHIRYVSNVYTHLESEYLNPEMAAAFLQFCFGKYINLTALQAYITQISIAAPGQICREGADQNAFTLALADGLVEFFLDDSILPKIKISESTDEHGVPDFDNHIQINGGNLNRVENAVQVYNNFVDSLNVHVMNSVISTEIDGQCGFDPKNASLECYRDIIMTIDDANEFDEILLKDMDDQDLKLNVVCYNNYHEALCDWFIQIDAFNHLSDNDKKKARKIAHACYLRRYALLTSRSEEDEAKSFREVYLRTVKLAIEEDSLYPKVVDLATLARLHINSTPALYSVEPLKAVTRAINPNIDTMSDVAFKEYFQKLIFRMIHLSMSPKIAGTLTPKKAEIFGSSISTQNLPQYEIEEWLKEYHRNKGAHTGSFGNAAFADTDYFDAPASTEGTLPEHLRTALVNIHGDGFGNAGMYYSSEIIRFIAAKLEKCILHLERNPRLTAQTTSTLDDISITLGMFLQGLHHCPNGRVEVVSKTFPRLMEALDISMLDTPQMSHIILKLAASDIIANTLQFHNIVDQRTQLAGENATFFAAALRLFDGNFGATAGEGFIHNWNNGTNLLKNYLERVCPKIWTALPRQTQLSISNNLDLTKEIVMEIMKTAMSPIRLIEYLAHERNVGTTDLLIQKYLDSRGIRGYNFSTTARRKQIIADILQNIGAI